MSDMTKIGTMPVYTAVLSYGDRSRFFVCVDGLALVQILEPQAGHTLKVRLATSGVADYSEDRVMNVWDQVDVWEYVDPVEYGPDEEYPD